jgi:hypothetical protein
MPGLFLQIFPSAAAAFSAGLSIAAFLRSGKRARAPRLEAQQDMSHLPGIVAGLKWDLTSLAERVSSLESEPREDQSAVTLRSGMNLNKRTQALRQFRLGQPSAEIAKSLDMPKAEVDLLVKVHRIVSQTTVL